LIATEVALSLVLLIGAGLLLNSFVRLSFVPPGINTENGLAMRIALPSQKYPDAERRAAFFEPVMERINGLPGVEYSGVTQTLPLAGYMPEIAFSIGGPPRLGENAHPVGMDFCTAGYFQAAGIPILKGRTFDRRDKPGAPGVIIINAALADQYFPNENPLGKRLYLLEPREGSVDARWEIVGIVGNVHQHGLTEPVQPCVYRPLSYSFIWHGGNLIIRSANEPDALVRSVRQAVLDVDPSQPVANIQTLKEIVASSVAQRRFLLSVVGGFAGAALLLAAIGLYGVMAYAVSQRTREIGVRVALGAKNRDVITMVVGQGMRIVAVGLALGLIGAFGLSHLLRGLLFGVNPTDLTTFVAVPLVLLAVTLFACWLPARRAAKVDPMEALRYE
jgi:putative ABC transport system permease protein